MENKEICFGRFRLHLGRRELLRDGKPVRLHPRALDILSALAAAKGEVLSKDALMARLWPGRVVEDGNLHVHVSALRKALDEHSEGHSYIVTVPGRGYRLAGLAAWEMTGSNEPSPERSLPLPDKPSIAVLPFTNMGGDPEQEYFASGMVEEIITALSRIRWLFVIARNSSFTYKGQAVDVKLVGRELGVRYVLEGSVRKAGARVRITAQLIDARSGAHLWADRFDGSPEDVFDLQDKVALSVAGVIEPTLQAAEIHRSSERPTSDLTAYDLYLRALPYVTSRERDRLQHAFDLLSRAIHRDPNYGPALAQIAYYYFQLDLHGWADDREETRRNGLEFARQALRCAPDDPEVLVHAAHVFGYFDQDIDAAMALVDRALALNPSFASGWYWSGVLRNWVGRPDVALEHFATFLRLSPRERFPFYLTGIGIALFFLRRFDEAIVKLNESVERYPHHVLTHRFLAASHAHLGRLDEARMVAARLRTLNMPILEGGTRYRNKDYRTLYVSGLRLAAGEAL
jgi:adenylate cyclase